MDGRRGLKTPPLRGRLPIVGRPGANTHILALIWGLSGWVHVTRRSSLPIGLCRMALTSVPRRVPRVKWTRLYDTNAMYSIVTKLFLFAYRWLVLVYLR